MPTYDYKCNTCEHEFEKVMKMDERDLPLDEPCPECETSGTIVKLLLKAPRTNYNVGDFRKKVPDGFKDVLRDIKRKYGPQSTIDV